jgi:hypothetical protein
MQNLTVHPGGPSPFLLGLAHARPRTRTPAPPGTVLVHPSDASLPFVSAGNACAAHVAHERHARAAARRCPPVGARPHGTPTLRGTPRPNPTLSPPLCCIAAEPFPPRSLSRSFSRLHSSPTPPLEHPTLPHRFPRLDRRLRPPDASPSRGFRPSTAAVRHSPVSSSPSYQSLQFPHPTCLSGAAGTHTRRRHPPEPLPRQ